MSTPLPGVIEHSTIAGNTSTTAGGGFSLIGTAVELDHVLLGDTPLLVPAIGVLGNDPDGIHSTSVIGTGPSHGTVVLNADGSFTYTPNPNYNGPDSYTYVQHGVLGVTGTVTVNITAAPATTTTTTTTSIAPVLAPPPMEELPATGGDSGLSTELALGLLGAGVVLTGASRRRRRFVRTRR
jgi:large repetitive protein